MILRFLFRSLDFHFRLYFRLRFFYHRFRLRFNNRLRFHNRLRFRLYNWFRFNNRLRFFYHRFRLCLHYRFGLRFRFNHRFRFRLNNAFRFRLNNAFRFRLYTFFLYPFTFHLFLCLFLWTLSQLAEYIYDLLSLCTEFLYRVNFFRSGGVIIGLYSVSVAVCTLYSFFHQFLYTGFGHKGNLVISFDNNLFSCRHIHALTRRNSLQTEDTQTIDLHLLIGF